MEIEELCVYVKDTLKSDKTPRDLWDIMAWEEVLELISPHAEEHPLLELLLDRLQYFRPENYQLLTDSLQHLFVIRERLKLIDDGYVEILKSCSAFRDDLKKTLDWLDEQKAKSREELPEELWVQGLKEFDDNDWGTLHGGRE